MPKKFDPSPRPARASRLLMTDRPPSPNKSDQCGGGPATGSVDTEKRARQAADVDEAIRDWAQYAQDARRAGLALEVAPTQFCIDRIEAGLEAWLSCRADKPRPSTLRMYQSNLSDFLIYLAHQHLSPAEVKPREIRVFKTFMQSKRAIEEMNQLRSTWHGCPAQLRLTCDDAYSASTIVLKLTIVRLFFSTALERGVLPTNPATEALIGMGKLVRRERSRVQKFKADEVVMLLNACREELASTPLARAKVCRDRAILALGAVHGLRISEIANLDLAHFDPNSGLNGAVVIKDRRVDLTPKMRALIDQWLLYRGLLNPTTIAMFVSLHHGQRGGCRPLLDRLDVRGIRLILDQLQRRLGMKKPGRSFRDLRHAIKPDDFL